MRALWSGDIAFGLVTIPTKLYAATRDLSPHFHLIHKVCGTRVQTVRRCPKCETDVPWNEIEKGYEVESGKLARFSKSELAEAEEDESKGTIEIVEFFEPKEVDLAFVEKSYWVGPSGKTASSFVLLRDVLEKTGRVALAKVAIRGRTRLALLRPRERLFSLDMMRFADELVEAGDVTLPRAKKPSEKELRLAKTLVDQLTATFDPAKYPDEYRARVAALAETKSKRHQLTGGDGVAARHAKPEDNVIDLSQLLALSLRGHSKPGPAKAAPNPHKTTVKKASSARARDRTRRVAG
jgi:DNA end-binding protein Ku